jgi:hypothetical protein
MVGRWGESTRPLLCLDPSDAHLTGNKVGGTLTVVALREPARQAQSGQVLFRRSTIFGMTIVHHRRSLRVTLRCGWAGTTSPHFFHPVRSVRGCMYSAAEPRRARIGASEASESSQKSRLKSGQRGFHVRVPTTTGRKDGMICDQRCRRMRGLVTMVPYCASVAVASFAGAISQHRDDFCVGGQKVN